MRAEKVKILNALFQRLKYISQRVKERHAREPEVKERLEG